MSPLRARLARLLGRPAAPAGPPAGPPLPCPLPPAGTRLDPGAADPLPLGAEALLCCLDPRAGLAAALRHLEAAGPGSGEVAAGRLIHLAAIDAWCADQPGRAALAEHARIHRDQLLGASFADEDAVLAGGALALAGVAWPALDCRAQGLGWIDAHLPRLVGEDGAPQDEAAGVARALWVAALVRAWAARPLPSAAEAAFVAGVDALWRLSGELGTPPGPPSPRRGAILPLGPAPLPWTLHNLAVAWGLDPGGPAASGDPAAALGAPSPTGNPERLAQKAWAASAFRASQQGVGWSVMLGQPGRVYLDARTGWLQWDLGGLRVLSGKAGSQNAGQLDVARVDGRKLRLVAAGAWRRDVLVSGSRLISRDRGQYGLRWRLGDPWALTPSATGYTAKAPGCTLEIGLDPTWTWTLEDREIHGNPGPSGAAEVSSSFEVRSSPT